MDQRPSALPNRPNRANATVQSPVICGKSAPGITPVAAAREGIEHRLGPARRELEHHAVSRRAASVRRIIEIAAAVGNQAGLGIRAYPD